MALSDEGNGIQATLPLAPAGYSGYPMMNGGGFGNGFGGMFGGDWGYFLLLLLICNGGWGGLGGFGMGGMMWPMMMGGMGAGFGLDYLYPWLNNSQHISDGFRDQQLNTTVQGIQNAMTSGFGDVQLGIAGINQGVSNAAAGINQNISTTGAGIQQALCNGFSGVNLGMANGFAGVNQSMSNGFAGVNQAIASNAAQGEISANARHSALTGQLYTNEIANLNRSFAEQTANTQGFSGLQGQIAQNAADIRLANCQTNNTIQAEGAASRYASAGETRDIIASQTANTQAILDKLCALELDTVKSQLAQAQRENVALQNAVNMATMQASQTEQTARILAGQAAEIDGVYNRLKNCPVNTVPVYGNQPVFQCGNGYNGCGCNAA